MNIYRKKSRWKLFLLLTGLIILAISTYYTNFLAKKLSEEEKTKVELWAIAMEEMANADTSCNLTLHSRIAQSNFYIPALIVDENDEINFVENFSCDDPDDPRLKQELTKMKASGVKPLELRTPYFTQYVYYKESRLLQMLSYFPLIQVFLVSAFILIGYWLFSSARKAEQNLVWVGMAKETAHQLGTPITAIMSWLETLKELPEDPELVRTTALEMENDVDKLKKIADRFSKIGSQPVLKQHPIDDTIRSVLSYFEKRVPSRIKLSFDAAGKELIARYNEHLLNWVLENLVRNALDAMDGEGEIAFKTYEKENKVYIELSDSGKGMLPNMHKRIFQPGFTTKKRGWGLGLSLAKRIMEQYHKGRISVKQSRPGKGTVFLLELPK
ncbi:MAG TPA: HAMP domain-containing sensor histidine kinase [Saprospiraceae bacterium]|nr:HAMP domain-containing sensor histidine kinase [Saprospiraceae bacterium]